MRARLAGGVAAVVLFPALLAGCGDPDAPGGEKARYIEQSDAICRNALNEAAGVGAGRDQETAQRLADIWRPAGEQLRDLAVPREGLETAERFVVDIQNLAMSYVAAARSAEVGDQADVDEAFRDVEFIKNRAAETADDYGYEVCDDIGQGNQ